MQTKFIRQDFDFSVDDPLDKSVNYGWGMHTMAVFRKRASQQTLGGDFIGTSFDDASPSHLLIHFANSSRSDLVRLSESVNRLVVACSNEANEEQHEFFKRNPGPRVFSTERFSLADATRLPEAADHSVSTVKEHGDPESRRSLLHWMRDTAWRLSPSGYVRSVGCLCHPGSKVPAVGWCSFDAPCPNRDLAPLEMLVVRYQHALALELERLSRRPGSGSPPTPWP